MVMKSLMARLITALFLLAFVGMAVWITQECAYAPITPGQTPLMVAVTGTKSVLVADDPTVAFDIYEDTQTSNRTIGEFCVDLSNFDTVHTTGDTVTIRVLEQIDGTTYRQLDNAIFTDNSITNHGIVKNFMSPGRKVKFTAQTSADRGAFVLSYSYSYRLEN